MNQKKSINYPKTREERFREYEKMSRVPFFKRSLDILVSLFLITAFIPLMLLISAAIALDSRGPIFYVSKRAGRCYRIFNLYKFRTMEIDADQKLAEISHLNLYEEAEDVNFMKFERDPRITRVGRILRSTGLDEIPQLLNILKGDMSLVGNRPLPLYEAEALMTDKYMVRFIAPAGLTGLWQVTQRRSPELSSSERVKLDIHYAYCNDFLGDMKILIKTPFVMFQRTKS